jgi:hypothetical protein
MTCVFLIHQNMSAELMERQYLLMIAMLNFDFQVHLVFTTGASAYWEHHKQWQQKLTALELYGIQQVHHLSEHTSEQAGQLQALLNQADFIS